MLVCSVRHNHYANERCWGVFNSGDSSRRVLSNVSAGNYISVSFVIGVDNPLNTVDFNCHPN